MMYDYNPLIILLIPFAIIIVIAILIGLSEKCFDDLYPENDTTCYQKSSLSNKISNIKTLFYTQRVPRKPPQACFFGRFGGEKKYIVGEVEPNYLDLYDRNCWERQKREEAYKQSLSNNKKENKPIWWSEYDTKTQNRLNDHDKKEQNAVK